MSRGVESEAITVTSFCLILKVLAVLAGINIARGCTILEIEKIETIIAALALIERAYATIVYATHCYDTHRNIILLRRGREDK